MIHLANFSLTEKMKKIILKEQCKVLCCFLTFLFFYFNAFQFPPSLFYTVSSKNFEKCRGLLLHLFSCRMNMCSMSLSSLNLMLLPNIQRKGGGGKDRTDICNKISSFIEPHDHNEAEHAFHTDHDFIT